MNKPYPHYEVPVYHDLPELLDVAMARYGNRPVFRTKRRVPTDAAPIVIVSDADVFTPDTDRVKPAWDRFFDRPAELIVLHGADHYFQKHRAADLSEIIRRIAQRA